MDKNRFRYIIIGAGLAGATAAEGIRERDRNGSVLLIGAEDHLPYDRPPLAKKLWTGGRTVAQIALQDRSFYDRNDITLALSTRITGLDAGHKSLVDSQGRQYRYEKLLLAVGGSPQRLKIEGGGLEGVCYYRNLDDYLRLRAQAEPQRSAVIVGGGFIGSELAASLSVNKVDVTMIFPSPYLCRRVFPEPLGRAVQTVFRERGVNILAEDTPVSISRSKGGFLTRTRSGHEIESDMVVAGIGIAPEVGLAQAAGLAVQDGVVVDEFLRTARSDIYAAGDLASFPCPALGRRLHIEHWDNARAQGLCAGRNMAGGREPYDYLPYFFSDLFGLGYEAVGEVDARLQTRSEWKKENDTGVVYYLRDGQVRGAMMCNVWNKIPAARRLISSAEKVGSQDLAGVLR